jgi:hypothetical protein
MGIGLVYFSSSTNDITIVYCLPGRRFSDLSTVSGTLNSFNSFLLESSPSPRGLRFAVLTKLTQRLPFIYTYILSLDSFTRFLEYSGSMIRACHS